MSVLKPTAYIDKPFKRKGLDIKPDVVLAKSLENDRSPTLISFSYANRIKH